MKIKTILFVLLSIVSSAGFAVAADLKAISSVYEIKAEVLRFARLRHEISLVQTNPVQQKKLTTQLEASVQELMLNLKESRPGLTRLNLQSQHQRMDSMLSDYLSESPSGGNKDPQSLQGKRNAVISLSDELSLQLVQKVGTGAANDVALIGSVKVSIEKLAHDFELCDVRCAQQLPADAAMIEKKITDIHTSLPKYFKKSSYDLAVNQMLFLKKSVGSKLRGDISEETRNNLIVTTGHTWKIVDEVLDAYVADQPIN